MSLNFAVLVLAALKFVC